MGLITNENPLEEEEDRLVLIKSHPQASNLDITEAKDPEIWMTEVVDSYDPSVHKNNFLSASQEDEDLFKKGLLESATAISADEVTALANEMKEKKAGWDTELLNNLITNINGNFWDNQEKEFENSSVALRRKAWHERKSYETGYDFNAADPDKEFQDYLIKVDNYKDADGIINVDETDPFRQTAGGQVLTQEADNVVKGLFSNRIENLNVSDEDKSKLSVLSVTLTNILNQTLGPKMAKQIVDNVDSVSWKPWLKWTFNQVKDTAMKSKLHEIKTITEELTSLAVERKGRELEYEQKLAEQRQKWTPEYSARWWWVSRMKEQGFTDPTGHDWENENTWALAQQKAVAKAAKGGYFAWDNNEVLSLYNTSLSSLKFFPDAAGGDAINNAVSRLVMQSETSIPQPGHLVLSLLSGDPTIRIHAQNGGVLTPRMQEKAIAKWREFKSILDNAYYEDLPDVLKRLVDSGSQAGRDILDRRPTLPISEEDIRSGRWKGLGNLGELDSSQLHLLARGLQMYSTKYQTNQVPPILQNVGKELVKRVIMGGDGLVKGMKPTPEEVNQSWQSGRTLSFLLEGSGIRGGKPQFSLEKIMGDDFGVMQQVLLRTYVRGIANMEEHLHLTGLSIIEFQERYARDPNDSGLHELANNGGIKINGIEMGVEDVFNFATKAIQTEYRMISQTMQSITPSTEGQLGQSRIIGAVIKPLREGFLSGLYDKPNSDGIPLIEQDRYETMGLRTTDYSNSTNKVRLINLAERFGIKILSEEEVNPLELEKEIIQQLTNDTEGWEILNGILHVQHENQDRDISMIDLIEKTTNMAGFRDRIITRGSNGELITLAYDSSAAWDPESFSDVPLMAEGGELSRVSRVYRFTTDFVDKPNRTEETWNTQTSRQVGDIVTKVQQMLLTSSYASIYSDEDSILSPILAEIVEEERVSFLNDPRYRPRSFQDYLLGALHRTKDRHPDFSDMFVGIDPMWESARRFADEEWEKIQTEIREQDYEPEERILSEYPIHYDNVRFEVNEHSRGDRLETQMVVDNRLTGTTTLRDIGEFRTELILNSAGRSWGNYQQLEERYGWAENFVGRNLYLFSQAAMDLGWRFPRIFAKDAITSGLTYGGGAFPMMDQKRMVTGVMEMYTVLRDKWERDLMAEEGKRLTPEFNYWYGLGNEPKPDTWGQGVLDRINQAARITEKNRGPKMSSISTHFGEPNEFERR